MRAQFLRVDKYISLVISYITSALLALAASLGLLQVLSRFLFKFPFEWTEVLIRISLNWMVFLGIAVVFRMGGMITVDMMRRLMPQKYQLLHSRILAVITICFLLFLGYWGWIYANRGATQTIIGLEFISVFWAYLSIPVGCFFGTLAVIANYIDPPKDSTDVEIENTI
ncbi:TRAP transporter small permease [Devosia sp. 2618]|uniref:TRAP transporter small permease n=1 Tax=Devosia sp. 2618 TaxID=3156454 RepID=UPI0033910447